MFGKARSLVMQQVFHLSPSSRTASMSKSRVSAPAILAGALLLAACPGPRSEQAEAPRPEFATTPPRVEASSVRLLDAPRDGNNAVLSVRFATDTRLGRTVAITPDSNVVVLRDDGAEPDSVAGDRNFAAFVQANPDELAGFQRHMVQSAARSASVPVFEGRVLAGQVSPARLGLLDTTRLSSRAAVPIRFFGFPGAVSEDRSLMVRDPAVLNDPTRTINPCTGAGNPNGKWTFNYLVTQMAGSSGVSPAAFVQNWLNQWLAPQTVNGWNVPARPGMQQILQAWPKLSNGDLDLKKAPFRLIAIVNRVDLRANSSYGGGNAGEGRFVFELVSPQCQTERFTVIFEYGVPHRFCSAVRTYGKQWLHLGSMVPGTPAYNTALEQITEQFAKANAAPSKPNGSALNQLRTNELALGVSPWELREFVIHKGTHQLVQTNVKQTPDESINSTQKLADYINTNATAILANAYTVPLQFQGSPFRGGAAPTNGGHFWDGPGTHPSAQITTANTRFTFSLNTCSGCHAGETGTPFQHLGVSAPGGISGFLTGITVTDPAGEQTGGLATTRSFDDLARRATDLDALVNSPCVSQLAFNPLRMVH
jgi:hypothetical protein